MAEIADLHAMADAVNSKETFLAFMLALAADRADEIRREPLPPSSPYGPDANGWENGTIETFLDAAAAWAGARSAVTGEPMIAAAPTWRSFAWILLAGKFYE